MIIRSKPESLMELIYTSGECPSMTDALSLWLRYRKAGKKAYTGKQELQLAMRIGIALAEKRTEVIFYGERIELIY